MNSRAWRKVSVFLQLDQCNSITQNKGIGGEGVGSEVIHVISPTSKHSDSNIDWSPNEGVKDCN